jgi:hypothetical protein
MFLNELSKKINLLEAMKYLTKSADHQFRLMFYDDIVKMDSSAKSIFQEE